LPKLEIGATLQADEVTERVEKIKDEYSGEEINMTFKTYTQGDSLKQF
jgi:hypothetical protein